MKKALVEITLLRVSDKMIDIVMTLSEILYLA